MTHPPTSQLPNGWHRMLLAALCMAGLIIGACDFPDRSLDVVYPPDGYEGCNATGCESCTSEYHECLCNAPADANLEFELDCLQKNPLTGCSTAPDCESCPDDIECICEGGSPTECSCQGSENLECIGVSYPGCDGTICDDCETDMAICTCDGGDPTDALVQLSCLSLIPVPGCTSAGDCTECPNAASSCVCEGGDPNACLNPVTDPGVLYPPGGYPGCEGTDCEGCANEFHSCLCNSFEPVTNLKILVCLSTEPVAGCSDFSCDDCPDPGPELCLCQGGTVDTCAAEPETDPICLISPSDPADACVDCGNCYETCLCESITAQFDPANAEAESDPVTTCVASCEQSGQTECIDGCDTCNTCLGTCFCDGFDTNTCINTCVPTGCFGDTCDTCVSCQEKCLCEGGTADSCAMECGGPACSAPDCTCDTDFDTCYCNNQSVVICRNITGCAPPQCDCADNCYDECLCDGGSTPEECNSECSPVVGPRPDCSVEPLDCATACACDNNDAATCGQRCAADCGTEGGGCGGNIDCCYGQSCQDVNGQLMCQPDNQCIGDLTPPTGSCANATATCCDRSNQCLTSEGLATNGVTPPSIAFRALNTCLVDCNIALGAQICSSTCIDKEIAKLTFDSLSRTCDGCYTSLLTCLLVTGECRTDCTTGYNEACHACAQDVNTAPCNQAANGIAGDDAFSECSGIYLRPPSVSQGGL
ncbi:MAG: hypothetical protein HRU17_01100 [Polyangiaceae bacterium]|nr:hypothetical protein [Polyangiaceae bacterium]